MHGTFERFESELARQHKSAATQRGYLSDLRDFVAWVEQMYGERFDPRRLVREDVRAYRSHLLNVRRQKPATINRKLASLASFCRWAVAEGLLESDPAAGVEGASQAQPPTWRRCSPTSAWRWITPSCARGKRRCGCGHGCHDRPRALFPRFQ